MIKITFKELGNYTNGYEIWLSKNRIFHFDNVSEAYLYYLDHFATQKDFAWCAECGNSKEDLRKFSNNLNLIQCQFDNVFNIRHHLYKVFQRKDGQVIRTKITEEIK